MTGRCENDLRKAIKKNEQKQNLRDRHVCFRNGRKPSSQ